MALSEFLATTSADDATALTEARAYTETRGQTISSDRLTMLALAANMYGVFTDVAADPTHSARGYVLALMDRLRTSTDFHFIIGDPKGDANLGMFDLLINSLMTEHATALQTLKDMVVAEANPTVKPFESVTLHEVKLARGNCPDKPVTQSGGYAVITTTAATELHNPRLLAQNSRTNKRVRINNFRGVSAAGSYDALVPPEWRNAELYVDDAYGVI